MFAILSRGLVLAVQSYRSEEAIPVPDDVHPAPGWTYADGIFTPPPPHEPTTVQLAERARAERDRLMREAYDPAVMQLLRKRRVVVAASGDTAGIDAQLAAWDAYANALEAVPEQAEFPSVIDWPTAPTAAPAVETAPEPEGASVDAEA